MEDLLTLRIDSYPDFQAQQQSRNELYTFSQSIEQQILQSLGQKEGFKISSYCYFCDAIAKMTVSSELITHDQTNNQLNVNWREGLQCDQCLLNNRIRAAFHFLMRECRPSDETAIYIAEQITPFYQSLKKVFPRLIGSEFLGSEIPLGSVNNEGIRNESLLNLSFQDQSIDVVITLDVFEHISNYRTVFSEIYRVLREQGILIFSVPFAQHSVANIIRAIENSNGTVTHLMEPEYHGNPLSEKGCLCYQYFGWQMLDELREVGFQKVSALNYWSSFYGYLGAGQMIFVAKKADISEADWVPMSRRKYLQQQQRKAIELAQTGDRLKQDGFLDEACECYQQAANLLMSTLERVII